MFMRLQRKVTLPIAWAFFMALLISFCFLPHSPENVFDFLVYLFSIKLIHLK